ncbi:MAG TPA: hypothetical protein VG167_22270 [Verrucomicrobiae bacterium]|nr:hypothetical protein [Verrucomicrobiae bacterium]
MALQYIDIPSLEVWKKDSNVTFAVRSKDQILTRIDELVDACAKAGDKGAWLYAATDLFFTLDYWLKIYKGLPKAMEAGREPAIMALYKCVVEGLCASFACTVNVLPRELEYYFGREMGFHGTKLDKALDCAQYLKRADVVKYKLFFKGGMACQFPWWDKTKKFGKSKLVLANSSRAYEPAVFQGAGRVNWGGFAMSMGRDIYMAKHHCTRDFGERGNFYHSSYLGGDAVMCAGTMLIEDGIIKGISTDSGHYRPSQMHVVNLLQSLQMRGVNVSTIEVQDHTGALVSRADVFMAHYGNWASALARRDANMTHQVLKLRENQEFEESIRKLWDDGVRSGTFTDDMPGRVFFAGVCLPNYTNRFGARPFEGMNFIFALNALARATSRNPDVYEKWIFEEWTRYLQQYHATDNLAGREQFARFEAAQPRVASAGWTKEMVLDLMKSTYQNKGLPWT